MLQILITDEKMRVSYNVKLPIEMLYLMLYVKT